MREALFFGQIQAFVEVASLGSMREAASSLFISQPAITSRLNRLEEELGASLIVRTRGRGARLSEVGTAFLPYAKQLLAVLDDAESAIAEAKQAVSIDLFVSATPTLSAYVLPAAMKRFLDSHHDVRLHLRSEISGDVLDSVRRGDVQIGFGRSLPHPDVECIPLYVEEWEFAVGRNHPLAYRDEVSVPELADEVFIHDGPSASYREFWARLLGSADIRPRRSIEVDNNETTKRLMAEGVGIGLLPKSASVEGFADGSLRRIAVKGIAPMRRQMAAMRLRNTAQSTIACDFLDLVTVRIREMGFQTTH